mgnify:CR=1 FL=1
MKFILLYRDYCSLCKMMLEQLKQLQTQYAFDIEIQDIDSDNPLLPQDDELVPVLLDENYHEICHWHFNENQFLNILNARRNTD